MSDIDGLLEAWMTKRAGAVHLSKMRKPEYDDMGWWELELLKC